LAWSLNQQEEKAADDRESLEEVELGELDVGMAGGESPPRIQRHIQHAQPQGKGGGRQPGMETDHHQQHQGRANAEFKLKSAESG